MGYDRPYNGDIVFVRQEGLKDYTRHYLYSTWRSMNIRCYDDRHKSFHRYGGRSITVCLEWRWDNFHGFVNFLNDMGDRPNGYTLDRIENDLSYSKDNCKWSTKKEQQNNISIGAANKSGNLGVFYDNQGNRWICALNLNGSNHTVGIFNPEEKELAVKLYNKIRDIKLVKGDDAAIEAYRSLKVLSPVGKRLRRNKTSKYYGVSSSKNGKWRAYNNEYVNGKIKQIHLGVYDSEEDAYQAVLNRLEDIKEEL